MATKKPRVMVVLESTLYERTKSLADAEGVSLSRLLRDLIRDACADREDEYWARVGEARLESFDPEKGIPHAKAWRKKR